MAGDQKSSGGMAIWWSGVIKKLEILKKFKGFGFANC
jgi:hypothetical protein